jgi:hypothetical protein
MRRDIEKIIANYLDKNNIIIIPEIKDDLELFKFIRYDDSLKIRNVAEIYYKNNRLKSIISYERSKLMNSMLIYPIVYLIEKSKSCKLSKKLEYILNKSDKIKEKFNNRINLKLNNFI